MNFTLAFIETKGFVGAIEAADAMTKTASVKINSYKKIGDGFVTVLIEGELSDCQAAIEAGSAAASRVGELISSGIIARPLEDLSIFKSPQTKKKIKNIPKKNHKKKIYKTDIIAIIKQANDGITIEELQKSTEKSKEEIRQLLKKLMDDDKIEKIHKKHYWIS